MFQYIYDKLFNNIIYKKKLKYFLPNYCYILYILGYNWNRYPIYFDNSYNDCDKNSIVINVSVNNERLDISENITSKSSCTKNIINYFYIICLTALLSWSFIYSIVIFGMYRELTYLTDDIFQLFFVSQYISGFLYFSKDHLYNILKTNSVKPLTYTVLICISFVLSLILSSVTLILFNNNQQIVAYSHIIKLSSSLWTTILINIILFFDKFFCYLVFFVNMITFSYVKIHNKRKIELFSDNLKTQESNNLSYIINTVSEEFFKIRKEHNLTIENLNLMFPSANITGLTAIYFTIKNINNKTFLIMEIVNIILFLIIEAIYIYCINGVKKSIDNIKEEMVSVNFVSQIFNKSSDIIIMNNHNNDINQQISYHSKISAISSVKSSETLSWIIMKDIIDSEWDSFKFLGFTIDDSYILQKIFGIIITIMIAKDISEGLSILQQ